MTDAPAPPVSVAFDRSQTRAAIRLFHPKGNSLTIEMIATLRAALESIGEYPGLKLLTIEGAGSDFSFGANVPEHAPEQIGRALPVMHRLIEELLELPVPTAAIVRGRCLGGGFELALACDFIFANEDAIFGLPEIKLGVFPPAASVLLPWRCGGARATHAILTGAQRSAREWHADGIVTIVAEGRELESAVDTWFVEHLADRSAAALRHAASAARSGLVAQLRAQLPVLETLYLDDLMRTADAVEGIAAFLERRPPRWVDR